MLIDPLTAVPLEMNRRLDGARLARAARTATVPSRRRRPRRGLALRLAAWATGRMAAV